MRRILLVMMMSLSSILAMAQSGTISGQVTDPTDGSELVGANVVIQGTQLGSTTDIDGKFTLGDLAAGSYTLEVSFIGYVTKTIETSVISGQNTDLGKIEVDPSSIGLQEVEVIASYATDRKTPVAFNTIEGKQIEAKVGNQEFPEMLRFTPSVYVTKQGGGFGDARINVRGFDQRNTAVLINGIPVNDMENGWVYWSNWAGLSDVTTNMQIQRGLGASKLAIPTIGGSINIITNAAEMQKGGVAGVMVGNDGYSKYSLALSTGLGKNGWAFTVQGTHTRGDGYVDGTMFRAYSYFLSLSKQINKQHSISFTGLGAPQWHHQRDWANPYTDYQEFGTKYNSDWGLLNGEEYTWRRNFYHKPKFFLNWYWNISPRTELATSAYMSFGRGGGTGPRGAINGSAEWRLPKDENGLHRFDDIVAWNKGQDVPDFGEPRDTWGNVNPGVDNRRDFFADKYVNTSSYGLIRRASMNSHNWFGVISNLTHKINEMFTLTAGIDLRNYEGLHYRRINSLLGSDAYYTNRNINVQGEFISQEKDANAIVDLSGDRPINYNNDGLVRWMGAYAQMEYSIDKLSAFISLSGSNQGFKRIDYFAYYENPALNDGVNMESEWANRFGGNVKLGLNYNINSNHNVFANGGYLSRQPIFDDIFPNFGNAINEDAPNQDIIAFEVGYGYRSRFAAINLNAYSTQWNDRGYQRSIRLGAGEGTANYTINQNHVGAELDFVLSPIEKLNITGMASVGNWEYKSDPLVSVYDDDQNLIGDTTLFLNGVKVGDAAQTTFSLGADYQIIEGLIIDASYYTALNLYADFDVASDDFFFAKGQQAWKLPSYSLVDLGITYNFDVGKTMWSVRMNVNNLLDTEYISESDTNILADEGDDIIPDSENGATNNRVFYGFGRTWNFGLKVRF